MAAGQHLGGRFGDFLANNVDWALSASAGGARRSTSGCARKDPEHREAPASASPSSRRATRKLYAHFHRAREADPTLSEHLIVHKPWIDQVTFACAQCGGTMRRVPEVIDCWFDSGCMPFAQWGYPTQNRLKEQVRRRLSRRLHQRGHRPDARVVLLAADDRTTLVFDEPLPPPSRRAWCSATRATRREGRRARAGATTRRPTSSSTRVKMDDFAVIDAARKLLRASPARVPARSTSAGRISKDGSYRLGRDPVVDQVDVIGDEDLCVRDASLKKGLPRRVILLDEACSETLGVHPTQQQDGQAGRGPVARP